MIQSSLILFEQYGFHGVSVNQIVENVGTSKGGFYHHFTSKDELLFEIHDTFITHVLEKGIYAYETHHSPTQKLKAIVKEFVNVFGLYKAHISVFYQESTYLKQQYQRSVKDKRDQFKQIVMRTIEEGKKSGEFREELSVEITTMAILGMVNWIYKWYRQSGANTMDEIGDIFVDLILHAVLQTETISKDNYKEILLDLPFFAKGNRNG
ncbi:MULTISPECIES: TetR/AcrR family transcriptional regulator [Oceanobacillus]|uniref:TetR/AcrR family transcriptional regulator n=1 Tax=Oceanobacillus profundus TaxID=372463 RepID=A0A417Y9N9_9BACI|nr:TetR/AcrR family transcriptional regulator [Oceanobacillus profundus]MBR3120135.1 TetR family transcriptional regulator [Oceanobacillus sp.]PAE29875.1 TetR family transcriptional regulator [Paenibacillus sp. 7884-2]RHW29412.1 TetR/AcrR family transcriptional regulator [Oceanobacillus profundus]